MSKEFLREIVDEIRESSTRGLPVELSSEQTQALWTFMKVMIELTQLNSFNPEEVGYLYELSPISGLPESFNS